MNEAEVIQAEAAQAAATAAEINARLAQAREKFDALVSDLRAVDGELGAVAQERQQHQQLQAAGEALQELERLGGAGLFWGNGAAYGTREEHLRRVLGCVHEFKLRLTEIETRRKSILREMEEQHLSTELLEEDAFEAQEEEERRLNEWIVEREIEAARFGKSEMPWTSGNEGDRRFRKYLRNTLLICLLFALVVPFIPLPLMQVEEAPEAPIAREFTMTIESLPKPPPKVERPPQPERVTKPVEKPEQPTRVAETPTEAPVPDEGILAFRENLSAAKESAVTARLGADARISSDDSSAAPERSMLTSNAPGSSGGIKLAAISRGLGGNGGKDRGAMQNTALTRAASSIGASAPSGRPLSNGARPSRTDEEIQIVFDRHKAQLYRLYNRELRKDPALQGKMILRLTIEPDGRVSFCQLHSTDMNAPELAGQVVERVQTFDFGAKDVPAITIVYPIDFLPSA
jgi:outer membrane biosynthesis protein TonB